MAYQIHYDALGRKNRKVHISKPLFIVAVLLILTVSLALADFMGATWVRHIFIPGEPATTVVALEDMAQSIFDGVSIKEAITAFCKEIIQNG